MVYFAYSHLAFISLLALTAINSGESLDVNTLSKKLINVNKEIVGVISDLRGAEERVQNIKDKILIYNASLRGELENYTNCLETAYMYSWGNMVFYSAF
uniref:Uncharacterized protein n=1 Tax=Trichobilharzia regenti TaxID=157069 RepID=A0AA85J565_TRIRE|nr:unnamed protein product [Trichobilharzia regenti]